MSSKASRWATTEADDALVERRKQEKLEKKRLKEAKAQRAAQAEAEAAAQAQAEHTQADERPAKRRRTSQSPAPEPETHLLSFPNPGFQPSGSVQKYELLNAIEEGSYGKVSRARSRADSTVVALKKLKIDNPSQEGFPITGLREIQTLQASSHPHIISLLEVVVGPALSE